MVTAGRIAQRRAARSQKGFTYLFVLIAVALIGIGLLATSEVWVTSAQRQRSAQLEWIGAQFTQAIGSYYQSSPGLGKNYPKSFDELLEDRRFGVVRRHLREVYRDPFTGVVDWEIVRASDSTMRGVRVSTQTPQGLQTQAFIYQPPPGY